ncbi:MAG: biotin carboxylase N-terminal domain-containing protein [bacterium]|nr:biotin carboxylase N-terminal domain-containing protein [bacterium]
MLKKVLIANRGEIAVRVIRACRELGLSTVAVHPADDLDSRHVREADQAFLLEKGYLDVEGIVALALQAGADAVHPGYGFLSENPALARRTIDAGLTWVGPNPDAIERMGSKTVARQMAEASAVPVVPGLLSAFETVEEALTFAAEHGYPCIVKAAAGGGGKGMQVVRAAEEFEPAIRKAQREGAAYFGSGEVFVERYLDRPRHVEIQILGDRRGQLLAVGERECSIQRRHQKLVEECPSPALDAGLRARMEAAAIALGRAVGYDSAGTCEFLVQDGQFYFLEMNTRIQVEHTVTEEVYGLDLVAAQLRVAAGEPLEAIVGDRLEARGWAIQCRINAEDPARNFMPGPGRLTRYRPPCGPGIRVDDGIEEGGRISERYDSMVAKLIARGRTRAEAIARMRRALDEFVVEGVPTTLPLHRAILAHEAFANGDLSTRFLESTLPPASLPFEPFVPAADAPVEEPAERTFEVRVNRERFAVSVKEIGGVAAVTGVQKRTRSTRKAAAPTASADDLQAPMHATVRKVLVEVGQAVETGQPLVVVEAMKMESELGAPRSGIVKAIQVQPGDVIEARQVLVKLGDADA